MYVYKKVYKLFSFIPILKIEYNINETAKVYLFCFLPILSFKKKYNWVNYNYSISSHLGKNLGCGGRTVLTPNTYTGEHCCFNGCEIHGGGKVIIGDYFHSGVNLLIIAQNHNYDSGKHLPYSPDDYTYKDIQIGNYVWVGSNVTILPGTKIGEGAIIQAGAVVHGEIPPLAIAGGNPIKVFKYRNKEHFEKLKAQKAFN